jgi:hydrogenase-4 component B
MSLIGGISILTFTKTFGTIFLGTPRKKLRHEPAEVSSLMLFPQYIIVAFMISIAFFPGFFMNLISFILNKETFSNISLNIPDMQRYVAVLKNISMASVIFILITTILLMARRIMTSQSEKKYASTWGCGYMAPNLRMQYTGKSFSKSFGKLLNFMLIEKKGFKEIERNETFPDSRRYSSFYLDIIDSKIIDPIIQLILRFINVFQFIQNGKIQAYVIYGIIFILTIFIGTVLNIWH